MKLRYTLLAFPIALLFTTELISQVNDFRVDYYTVDDGLSQNQVFCIYPDSKGLLWFGTQDGLNLYDGYKFRVFRHQPGNENSLLDYAVNTICETDTGIFWIGTREGMSRLDLRTGKFTHYTHNPDSSNSLVDNTIWLIVEDSEGKLWIATKNGLSRFNPATAKFDNYVFSLSDTNTISHNFVFEIIEDNDKNIWLGGRGGLDRYDLKKKKFFSYKLFPEKPNDISLNGIVALFIKNDIIWIGSYSGFYSANINDLKEGKIYFKRHFLEKNKNISVRSIFAADDGVLWVGTFRDGLFRYNPRNGKAINYTKTGKPGSISENSIASLYEDKHRVLWIGTSNYGLNKYNRFSEKFRTIIIPESNKEEKSGVSSLFEDRSGNLWIGIESGNIIKITGQFTDNPQIKFFNTIKSLETYFSSIEIRSLIENKNGQIWGASFGNGIYVIDPVTDMVKRITEDENKPNTIANDFVHSLYQASDGIIWIGTGAGGLNKYNPNDGSFTYYQHDPKNNKSISVDEVTAVCEDKHGFIWAGTSIGGLNRLNPSTGEFEHFTHNVSDVKSVSSNRIICLYADKKSNLWIGTFGGGLNKWNPDGNSFTHYTTEDGLPSNIINSIVEDNSGNLWITTDKGISVFKVELNTFENYDVKDGLQGNHFLQGAGFASKVNGHIYVGGINGLNIFNPLDCNTQSKLSDIVLTDFKIFSKSVLPGVESALSKNILYAEEIILSYDENFFTFEFASLDFNNPDKNLYAYKMEGFNDDWIFSGTQRFATYTNLDPGEYIFRVKATNSNGAWNDKGISIRVTLLPPWWQTWWAYFLYAAAIIAILLFIRQFEMKRVKLRNELELKYVEAKKLQEVDKLKSRFFANISHEFRTPLTLVLGLTDKFLKKVASQDDKKDLTTIRRNAHRLLQLINQLLELSKLESGNVKLLISKYDINKFLRRVLASFISLVEQRNLTLTLNGSPINAVHNQKEVFIYFDPEKFETVIYNLISNAIKFSPEGERIEVEVIPHLHRVDLRITNTGIGIPEEKLPFIFDRFYQVDETSSRGYEGTGIGLALVRELVELHNGEIKVMSIEGKETTFIIKIPVGRAHYKPEQIIETPSGKEIEEVLEPVLISDFQQEDIFIEPGIERKISSETKTSIVLVVEDNDDLRNYITEQLEDKYMVFEVGDGEKGLQMAAEILPDLIISDIMMPKLDGYKMCKKLKKDFKTSHIPIIMLTAKATKDDKLEGLETGADDYLIKPFDSDELLIRVKNLINLRQQLREKYRSEMILKPHDVIVPSSEKVFLDKLTEIIEAKIEDEKFGVDELSKEIGLSRSQLHRKLKAVSDQSTTEFIRNHRLQRAANLIKQDAGNMAEIAYKVGFSSQAYFNKSFLELFGCSPGEYKKNNNSQ